MKMEYIQYLVSSNPTVKHRILTYKFVKAHVYTQHYNKKVVHTCEWCIQADARQCIFWWLCFNCNQFFRPLKTQIIDLYYKYWCVDTIFTLQFLHLVCDVFSLYAFMLCESTNSSLVRVWPSETNIYKMSRVDGW